MALNDLGFLEGCQLDLTRDVIDWLETLRQADQMFYNIMTLELWSIAQTMDELHPGFWADYMRNRQEIVRQQLQQRRYPDTKLSQRSPRRSIVPRPVSPIATSATPEEESSTERVSLFSDDLAEELPKLKRSVHQPLEPLPQPPEPVTLTIVPSHPTPDSSHSFRHLPDLEPIEMMTQEVNSAEVQSLFKVEHTPAQEATLLTPLPHLIRSPQLRVLPLPANEANAPGNAPGGGIVTITCWLTRHFLVRSLEQHTPSYTLQRLNQVTLEPGRSVICRLGFVLPAIPANVRVQLAKSIRAQSGLSATWLNLESPPSESLATSEAAIHVINQGNQAFTLQAGQPFCRLEFRCAANHLPKYRPGSLPSVSAASEIAAR